MRLPSTFPPKSSTAICAAATEPGPLRSEYRPVISVSTPILTTSSDTCAPANDVVTKSAATLEIARTKYLGFMSFLPFDEPDLANPRKPRRWFVRGRRNWWKAQFRVARYSARDDARSTGE